MTIKRRPRGTLHEPTSIGWKVEKASKDRFAELAEKSGYTSAAFFDLMVKTVELDSRGIPAWVPTEIEKDQLPIDKP
ncbi:hypothetical protein ACR9WD_16555 (plasmid) [Glutamicibacter sp. PAEs-4]|uniref:hypothetical protein n=1 Tax=Glutamicibacter sp. PAEs-4 TaxID=3444114 RepID=UPI003EBC0FC8